jgi:hypothetical protein
MAKKPVLIDTHWQREYVEHETSKALLFVIPQGETIFAQPRQVWLPKSQVTWIAHDPYAETAHIPAWLARNL